MERYRRMTLLLLLPALLLFAYAGCDDPDDNGPVGPDQGPPDPIGEVVSNIAPANMSGQWTVEDSLVIPENQTTTIAPGTQIYFRRDAKMVVYGTLISRGAPDSLNWITMTSLQNSPDRGDWKGVVLIESEDSEIAYTKIAYGAKYNLNSDTSRIYLGNGRAVPKFLNYRGAITVYNCSPWIHHNVIELGGYDGINILGSSQPVIEYNTIVQNAFNGIHVEPDWSLIVDTLASTYDLIYENLAPAMIRNNIIVENDDAGIRLPNDLQLYEVGLVPEIQYNDIWNNASLDYVPPSFRDAADVSTDIHLNPVFVDLEARNYRLHACSGVIDKGEPDEVDPDGTRADMGAMPLFQAENDLLKELKTDDVFDKLNLRAGEVYNVRCDIWVPEGEILTIEPGVTLAFDGRYSLRVYGGIQVNGEQGNEVLFTSSMVEPGRGDWQQIVLDHTTDESWIENTIIEYSSMENLTAPSPDTLGALSLMSSSPRIDNVTIRETFYVGLYCFDGSNPEVDRLTVNGAGLHGVAAELNSNPMLTRTTIHDVGGYGIMLLDNSSPTIENLLMYSIGTAGILAQDLSSPEIDFMTLYGKREVSMGGLEPVTGRIANGVRANSFARPLVRNSIVVDYDGTGVLSQVSSRPDLRYLLLTSDVDADQISGNVDSTAIYTFDPQFRNPEEFDFRLEAGSEGLTAAENGGEIGAYGGNGM